MIKRNSLGSNVVPSAGLLKDFLSSCFSEWTVTLEICDQHVAATLTSLNMYTHVSLANSSRDKYTVQIIQSVIAAEGDICADLKTLK